MQRRGLDRYAAAIVGWVGIVVWVVCVDEFAVRSRRATMSKGFGDAGANPDLGPFTVGGWLGLCFHFAGEVIRSWRA